jgi:hypothetical protein
MESGPADDQDTAFCGLSSTLESVVYAMVDCRLTGMAYCSPVSRNLMSPQLEKNLTHLMSDYGKGMSEKRGAVRAFMVGQYQCQDRPNAEAGKLRWASP